MVFAMVRRLTSGLVRRVDSEREPRRNPPGTGDAPKREREQREDGKGRSPPATSKLEGRRILPAPVVMPVGVTLSIWMATAGKLSGSHPLYSPRARPWSTPSASLGPQHRNELWLTRADTPSERC